MRGLIGVMLAAGLLAGCGGAEANVDPQGPNLKEQEQAMWNCGEIEGARCYSVGAETIMSCHCSSVGPDGYGSWRCM
jgi:hypothetical protein